MKRSDSQAQTTKPLTYKKGGIQPGPASLPTALLLDNNHFTKVIHRDISPAIPIPATPRVNTHTIVPTLKAGALTSEFTDAFLYIIDLLPHDYISLKVHMAGEYYYLNANFRMLADQLGVHVLDKTERDCLKSIQAIHHPLIASIRRTDPHHTSTRIKWVEEEATDQNNDKHLFYSWKIPIFTVKKENPLMAICTRTLAFSQLSPTQKTVLFKRPA